MVEGDSKLLSGLHGFTCVVEGGQSPTSPLPPPPACVGGGLVETPTSPPPFPEGCGIRGEGRPGRVRRSRGSPPRTSTGRWRAPGTTGRWTEGWGQLEGRWRWRGGGADREPDQHPPLRADRQVKMKNGWVRKSDDDKKLHKWKDLVAIMYNCNKK